MEELTEWLLTSSPVSSSPTPGGRGRVACASGKVVRARAPEHGSVGVWRVIVRAAYATGRGPAVDSGVSGGGGCRGGRGDLAIVITPAFRMLDEQLGAGGELGLHHGVGRFEIA